MKNVINGSAFGTINADERAALACWRAFATDHAAPDLPPRPRFHRLMAGAYVSVRAVVFD